MQRWILNGMVTTLSQKYHFLKRDKLDTEINLDFIYTSNNSGNSKLISKNFKTLTPNSEQLEKFYELLKPVSIGGEQKNELIKENNKNVLGTEDKSIFSFLILAFLGGLILNLMPCVLPVITLKLFSLTSISGESNKKIASHNLFYSIGVLSTFGY